MTLHCSFCGILDSDEIDIVAGPSVYICRDCIVGAQGVIDLIDSARTKQHEIFIAKQRDDLRAPAIGSEEICSAREQL